MLPFCVMKKVLLQIYAARLMKKVLLQIYAALLCHEVNEQIGEYYGHHGDGIELLEVDLPLQSQGKHKTH